MKLSTVILPYRRFAELRDTWIRAEELNFASAYTYDHLSWRSFRDGPWFAALPTLAAAAMVTDRIGLGTLVTSPNFRHPVPLAKDLLALDDLSNGRLRIGVGAGGIGDDSTVLGDQPWPPRERTDRFVEFVELLEALLREPDVTRDGTYYRAVRAVGHPGPIQLPRPPLLIAATGRRGIELVAAKGDGWVTYGDPAGGPAPVAVGAQRAAVALALEGQGRSIDEIETIFLHGLNKDRSLTSVDAFIDMAGTYASLGVTELVIHWPIPESPFASDLDVFEALPTEIRRQLGPR